MFSVAFLIVSITLMGSGKQEVMTKTKGVYTINTTTLSTTVSGFMGPTPLLITIEKDKILKVKALENSETPEIFVRVTAEGSLLDSWNGMQVDKALATQVDAVTGATLSSNAIIENMRLGLNYYKEHKK